jgi:hypothetical protein
MKTLIDVTLTQIVMPSSIAQKISFGHFKTSVSNLELLMRDVAPTMSVRSRIIVGTLVQMMWHLQTNSPMEKSNVYPNILKIS